MSRWKNFFIQKMGTATGGGPHPVYESVATWGIFCKDMPFKVLDKVKEPAKNSWYDEDGDDEYISDGGLKAEAYTMKVELACKKTTADDVNRYGCVQVDDVRQNVGEFLDFLRLNGMMKVYSSHTRIGRQYVRLSSVGDKCTWYSDTDGEFLVFEVELKVNDPVTDITLGNG